MANILIDILGEDEEENLSNKQKAKELRPEVEPLRPRVRKQVINIEGEIVDM